MKNKKIFFLLIGVLIVILIAIFFIIKNFNSNSSDDSSSFLEYIPEEEISSKQLRNTVVTLYFVDSENNIKSEGHLIDSVLLLNNPYIELVNLLIEGPNQSNLVKVFPENTSILEANIDNNCVVLNFSKDILNYGDDIQKNNIINCLLNTLTELNEVNSFKILVENSTHQDFNDEYAISH